MGESIIDPLQKSLDRAVFENPDDERPRINPLVSMQIQKGLDQIGSIAPVFDAYLVGSILGKRYNRKSDIDVSVEILEKDADDETRDKLYDLIGRLNGTLAHNSTHPINYHLAFVDEEGDSEDKFDNIYGLDDDSWRKKTEDRHVDPSAFMDDFEERVQSIDYSAMEIRRDLIDLDALKEFSRDEVEDLLDMVQEKLDDIEDNIREMADSEEEIADLRRDAFKYITKEQLKKLGTANALPINIIYKLMERYCYVDLIAELRKILEKDDEIGEDDVPEIKKAFRKFDDQIDDDMDGIGDGEISPAVESRQYAETMFGPSDKPAKRRGFVCVEDAVDSAMGLISHENP